jgi:hypothetical protein
LTYTRLPPLTEAQAFAVSAADELLKEGMTPRALMKGLGLDPAALDGLEKYNPDQPRVPAGNSDGGQWTRDGNTGTGPGRHVRYAANGTFPPVPPGYDPNSWKQGKWPNDGPYWLEDPDGRKYTVHPEDDRHWRHWDIQDSDGDDQGRWPPNSKKPWSTQKRKPDFDQSLSDPNGDAPPWSPDPFVPVVPQPILPIVPIPSIPIEPVPFPIPPVLVPG